MTEIHSLVIGKFSPPHRGHGLMLQFAANISESLTVLVADHSTTPRIWRRRDWIDSYLEENTAMYYDVLQTPTPDFGELQYDENRTVINNEPFWNYWIKLVGSIKPLTHIISSDHYGQELAKRCELEWIPFDPEREMTGMLSASSIRAVNNGYSFKNLLSDKVRRHYTQTICLVGTESTGKTKTAKAISSFFNATYVPEYGRTISEVKGKDLTDEDFEMIRWGQRAMNDVAMSECSRPLVVFDTDMFATYWFKKFYLDKTDDDLLEEATQQGFDKYILLAPTIPWEDDGSRVMMNQKDREQHHDEILEFLTETKKDFDIIDNTSVLTRERQAMLIASNLLREKFRKP